MNARRLTWLGGLCSLLVGVLVVPAALPAGGDTGGRPQLYLDTSGGVAAIDAESGASTVHRDRAARGVGRLVAASSPPHRRPHHPGEHHRRARRDDRRRVRGRRHQRRPGGVVPRRPGRALPPTPRVATATSPGAPDDARDRRDRRQPHPDLRPARQHRARGVLERRRRGVRHRLPAAAASRPVPACAASTSPAGDLGEVPQPRRREPGADARASPGRQVMAARRAPPLHAVHECRRRTAGRVVRARARPRRAVGALRRPPDAEFATRPRGAGAHRGPERRRGVRGRRGVGSLARGARHRPRSWSTAHGADVGSRGRAGSPAPHGDDALVAVGIGRTLAAVQSSSLVRRGTSEALPDAVRRAHACRRRRTVLYVAQRSTIDAARSGRRLDVADDRATSHLPRLTGIEYGTESPAATPSSARAERPDPRPGERRAGWCA